MFPLPYALLNPTAKWSSAVGHTDVFCYDAEMLVAGQSSRPSPLLLGGFPVMSLSAWWPSPWWSYLKILFPLMWFQTELLHKHWDEG